MSGELGFKIGNESALEHIKEFYFSKLVELCDGLIKDDQKAKEVVNDVFTCLWQLRERFNTFEDVKSFLYVTTRHNSLRYLQQAKTSNNS